MVAISKLMLIITFLLAVVPFNHARPMRNSTVSSSLINSSKLDEDSPNSSPLINRLKLDEESPDCWDSLFQIHACTGELILFFMNGETYIGDACCHAIRSITHKCWPAMLGTIGFTTGEGDILDGYCDHKAKENEDHASRLSPPRLPKLELSGGNEAVGAVKSYIP